MAHEKAKKIANRTAGAAGGTVRGILKVLLTILLIILLTGLLFICIFAYYVKTSLMEDLKVTLSDFKVELSTAMLLWIMLQSWPKWQRRPTSMRHPMSCWQIFRAT